MNSEKNKDSRLTMDFNKSLLNVSPLYMNGSLLTQVTEKYPGNTF